MKKLACILIVMSSVITNAEELITFQEGQIATASDVNHNFSLISEVTNSNVEIFNALSTELYSRALTSRTYVTSSPGNVENDLVSEVVVATCPSDEVMTGGGVYCHHDDFDFNTTNFGLVFSSVPSGNSYFGGCGADSYLHSSLNYGPPVTVYAVCASIVYKNSVSSSSNPERISASRYSDKQALPLSSGLVSENGDQNEQGEMDDVATATYYKVKEQLETRRLLLQEMSN